MAATKTAKKTTTKSSSKGAASAAKPKAASAPKASDTSARKTSSQSASSRPASSEASELSVGASAPEFKLVADDGREVSLAELRGKKVVLYFYPKDNTPGCTREACDFQASLAALKKKGAVVFGVSRDSSVVHQGFKKKQGLTFPLLTDADGEVHGAYGAWGDKVMYGKTIHGALRTTVIIDEKGKIAKVFPRVRVDGHAAAVLDAL